MSRTWTMASAGEGERTRVKSVTSAQVKELGPNLGQAKGGEWVCDVRSKRNQVTNL